MYSFDYRDSKSVKTSGEFNNLSEMVKYIVSVRGLEIVAINKRGMFRNITIA